MLLPSNYLETAEIVWVGVPREPEDFVKHAALAGHPKRFMDESPGPQISALVDNLLDPCLSKDDKGSSLLRRWKIKKTDLAYEEFEIKKTLDCQVSKIIEPKQTILLDTLLKELKFPDRDLASDIRSGFKLSGWLKNTGLFVPEVRPPSCSLTAQTSVAKARDAVTLAKLRAQKVDKVSQAAWAETQEELAKGWLFHDPNPDLSDVLL